LYILQSPNTSHKITDRRGEVVAQFEPTPAPDPKKGIYPTHGIFVTEDASLAKALLELSGQGITLAPGSKDPASPLAAPPVPAGDQGGKKSEPDQGKK
jgi:hypothetical protein